MRRRAGGGLAAAGIGPRGGDGGTAVSGAAPLRDRRDAPRGTARAGAGIAAPRDWAGRQAFHSSPVSQRLGAVVRIRGRAAAARALRTTAGRPVCTSGMRPRSRAAAGAAGGRSGGDRLAVGAIALQRAGGASARQAGEVRVARWRGRPLPVAIWRDGGAGSARTGCSRTGSTGRRPAAGAAQPARSADRITGKNRPPDHRPNQSSPATSPCTPRSTSRKKLLRSISASSPARIST